MKLKYLLLPILALGALITGCSDDNAVSSPYSEISVEPSFVAFKAEGGEMTAEVNAEEPWTIENFTSDWLEVSPMNATAGITTVTFKAKENAGSSVKEIELKIKTADKVQFVKVALSGAGAGEIVITPIKDVLAAEDGKIFTIKGTVSNIINTLYGNFNVTDEAGSTIFIYGMLDANGAPKNFESLNVEDGDKVVITGPKASYNGKPQMKEVSLVKLKKSLIKMPKTEFEVEHEAGTVEAEAILKGGDINVTPACSWASIRGINKSGDKTIITIAYEENTELDKRKGSIVLKSGEDQKTIKLIQAGRPATDKDIVKVNIKDLLAAEIGGPRYTVSGVISEIVKEDYGNIMLSDGTGTIYVFGLTSTNKIGEKNDKTFKDLGLKVGDFITVTGVRSRYEGAKDEKQKEQLGGPAFVVSSIKAEEMSITTFLSQELNNEKRYILTGTVKNIGKDKENPEKVHPFGKFTLVGEDGAEVYVFGLVDYPMYNIGGDRDGKFNNNKSFESLNIKEGDEITICSKLGEYKGNKQAIESYLISK